MKYLNTFLLGIATIFSPLLVQAAPSGALINPNADANAKALIAYLLRNYGSRTLSGQQDESSTNWVTQNIGKTPAITGFDFMDYSPSRVAYGSSSTNVEQAVSWARRGGIVTFCWHWGSPSGSYNSASQPWWSNFYTEATGFDVAAAMNSPGSTNYNLIVRDIDAIAIQLKRLQAEGIPVLWRPLHEAEGTWFWWGAKGAEPCKKLWALLYDRLTNYHKLNNLIWVWNSVASSWYPGNNLVDIVSLDVYASAGNHDPQTSSFNSLKSLCGDTKIIAMTECGVIPNWSTSAPWSYWVVWNGEFIDGGNHNSRSYLQTTYNSQNVLALDEISGWKSSTSPTTTTFTSSPALPTTTTTSTRPPSGNGSPLVSSGPVRISCLTNLLTSMDNVVDKGGQAQLLALQALADTQILGILNVCHDWVK
ncbi:hypothetical protein ACLOAV_007425 [Pseudogymnoascus australis]